MALYVRGDIQRNGSQGSVSQSCGRKGVNRHVQEYVESSLASSSGQVHEIDAVLDEICDEIEESTSSTDPY